MGQYLALSSEENKSKGRKTSLLALHALLKPPAPRTKESTLQTDPRWGRAGAEGLIGQHRCLDATASTAQPRRQSRRGSIKILKLRGQWESGQVLMQAAEIGEFQKEPTLKNLPTCHANSSSAAALHPQSERAHPGYKHNLLTPSLPFLFYPLLEK